MATSGLPETTKRTFRHSMARPSRRGGGALTHSFPGRGSSSGWQARAVQATCAAPRSLRGEPTLLWAIRAVTAKRSVADTAPGFGVELEHEVPAAAGVLHRRWHLTQGAGYKRKAPLRRPASPRSIPCRCPPPRHAPIAFPPQGRRLSLRRALCQEATFDVSGEASAYARESSDAFRQSLGRPLRAPVAALHSTSCMWLRLPSCPLDCFQPWHPMRDVARLMGRWSLPHGRTVRESTPLSPAPANPLPWRTDDMAAETAPT